MSQNRLWNLEEFRFAESPLHGRLLIARTTDSSGEICVRLRVALLLCYFLIIKLNADEANRTQACTDLVHVHLITSIPIPSMESLIKLQVSAYGRRN